jgi:hypothetical protein
MIASRSSVKPNAKTTEKEEDAPYFEAFFWVIVDQQSVCNEERKTIGENMFRIAMEKRHAENTSETSKTPWVNAPLIEI